MSINPSTAQLRIRLLVARADFDLKVDLQLPGRGIVVLFGASGSGKTTLLRSVAGLLRPSRGLIQLGDTTWQDDGKQIFVPPWQRKIGYVFQEASLFAHLDVRRNLRYGLERGASKGTAEPSALQRTIDLLGIDHLLGREPSSLSGGERQRVAIARALATQPRLLLLDEPLAALDHARRQEILPWLERMRDELNIPMIYVTHSADELARLADHLVVLERGTVKADGPAHEVLARTDAPVIRGDEAGALLLGHVAEIDAPWHLARVQFAGGSLWVRDSAMSVGQSVRLRVLARDVSLMTSEPANTSIQNHLEGRIEAIAKDVHPSQALVKVRVGDSALLARVTARAIHALALKIDTAVWVQVKSVAVMGGLSG